MAIEQLSGGSAQNGAQEFTWLVDYDTTAKTIGLTCTGGGHATLQVVRASNGVVLGAVNADQFGQTAGPLVNGASQANDVTYDGTRHIVVGPGASGVDVNGSALPTGTVSSTVVGTVAPPKGTQPGLFIELAQHFASPLA